MKIKYAICALLVINCQFASYCQDYYGDRYGDKQRAKDNKVYNQQQIDNAKVNRNTPSTRSSNSSFEWQGEVPYLFQTKEQRAADQARREQADQAAFQREQARIQEHQDYLQRIANANAERKYKHLHEYEVVFKPKKYFSDLEIKIMGEETFYFANYDQQNSTYKKAIKFIPKLKEATMDEPFDTLVNYIWNARLFPDFSLSYLNKLKTIYPAQKEYLERYELHLMPYYFGSNTVFQSTVLGYIYPLCGFELMSDEQKIRLLDRFEELESLYPESAKIANGQCRLGFNMYYKYATSNLQLKNKTDAKRLEYLYKTLETVQAERVLPPGGWRDDTWKETADLYLRPTAMELKLIYPDFVQSLSSEKWLAISDAYQINVEYIAWAFRDKDYYDDRYLKLYPNLINARKKEFKNETDGVGVLNFKNRDKYTGEIKNGKPNGKGKLTTAIGEFLEGNFKDGKLDGFGRAFYLKNSYPIHEGDLYEGEFKNGVWHGKGTVSNDRYGKYKYKNSGNWVNGKLNGEGEASFTNEKNQTRVRKGSYKDNIPDGFGIQTNYDGSVYEGNFKNRYDGQGVLTYPDGSILIAKWNDGSIVGKAKLTSVTGFVKTYEHDCDKKSEKCVEKNIKYFNPSGKEIPEAEYIAGK